MKNQILKHIFIGLSILACMLACQSDDVPVFYGRVKYIRQNNVLRFEFLYDQNQRLKEWRGYFRDERSLNDRTIITRNEIGQVIASENWSISDVNSSDIAKPSDPMLLRDRRSYEYNAAGQMVQEIDLFNSSATRLRTTEYRYSTVGGLTKIEVLGPNGRDNGYRVESSFSNNQQTINFYTSGGIWQGGILTEYDGAVNPFYDPTIIINFIPTDCVDWLSPQNELARYQIDTKGNKIRRLNTTFEMEYNAQRLPTKKTMYYSDTSVVYDFRYE